MAPTEAISRRKAIPESDSSMSSPSRERIGIALALVAAERLARSLQVGLWQDGATIEKPWEYRQQQTAAAGSTAPGDCVIKGNINSKGARIYHRPGQRDYDRTRISTGKGGR